MHAQINGKDRACGSGDILADKQTDTHTHILITILPHPLRGEVMIWALSVYYPYAG